MQVPTGNDLPTADGRVQMYPCHSFEFHVVLAVIDPDLGKTELRRYVIGHDCGTVINPHIVKGMTLGGIAHGIGAALMEEFVYGDDGQMMSQSFMDYLLPSAHEVPRVEIVHHCTPSPFTVLGQKGSGESGYLGAPAAVASAINDAVAPLGIAFDRLPDPAHGDQRRGGGGARQTGRTRMTIDCHAHFVPPSLLEAVRAQAGTFPSLRLVEDGAAFGFSFSGGKPTRPVSKPLSDLAARLKWMDEQKIERQVVGGWLDMFGYELPVEEGARWSRLANEHLLAAAKAEPRLIPLATVPLQDGARAAEVLREARGFAGAMIGTQPKGVGGVLDDPALDPFWRAADELGSALFIHPVFESGDDRVHDYGMANALGRITDTLIAVTRIIYSGHLTRYRNAKVIDRHRRRRAALCGRPPAPQPCARPRQLGDPDAALRRSTTIRWCMTRRCCASSPTRSGPAGSCWARTCRSRSAISRRPRSSRGRIFASEIASITGGLAQRLFVR
jgi:aminocarboxymuconate-semialdehyde decarboxylase